MVRRAQEAPLGTFYNLSFEDLNIIDTIQELWLQYIMWERSLLMTLAFNHPNLEFILNRIYRVPLDFYNTLRVFYGTRVAQQMLDYLQNRINSEIGLIDAMIRGDQSAVDAYTENLYRTTDELAEFFGQFPYWDAEEWKSLLYRNIGMFIDEIRALLSGDYEREIIIFETMMDNAAAIGRFMAAGILASSMISSPGTPAV